MTRRVFYPSGAAGNPFYQLNGYKITPVVVNWAVIVVIVELKILLQHYFGTGNIATTATVIGNYYPCSCGSAQSSGLWSETTDVQCVQVGQSLVTSISHG